jgi:hypothetical protein
MPCCGRYAKADADVFRIGFCVFGMKKEGRM